jgi:alpha,alpha-trehalase
MFRHGHRRIAYPSPDRVSPTPAPPEYKGACVFLCDTSVLLALYQAGLMNGTDSKMLVDRVLRSDPGPLRDAFLGLPDKSPASLSAFLSANTDPTGSDLLPWLPPDWERNVPSVLAPTRVADPRLAQFAGDVHGLWRLLGKQAVPDVSVNPQRHTLLPTRFPFIAPGGRFEEFYYWDSYWIILGLLASNMTTTAQTTVLNLADFVTRFGFVPNGGREYYTTRSQPPFLTLMVAAVAHADQLRTPLRSSLCGLPVEVPQLDVISNLLPILEDEYAWWMANRAVSITRLDGSGIIDTLNRYFVQTDHPRPESWYNDESLASEICPDPHQRALFFSNLASGAESGMDYSSRWFLDGFNETTVDTSNVLPVDLNAILGRVENTLAYFYELTLANPKRALALRQLAVQRAAAMQYWMWSAPDRQWRDFNTRTGDRGQVNAVTNFLPLWSGLFDQLVNTSDVVTSLVANGIWLPGGLATTV